MNCKEHENTVTISTYALISSSLVGGTALVFCSWFLIIAVSTRGRSGSWGEPPEKSQGFFLIIGAIPPRGPIVIPIAHKHPRE